MTYSVEKINVMQHLGTGLSVENLCLACNLTYNQLCELAQEHADLYHELKKWYKRFDFVPQSEDVKPTVEQLKVAVEKLGKLPEGIVVETVKIEDIEDVDDKPLETKEKSKSKPKKSKKKVETK